MSNRNWRAPIAWIACYVVVAPVLPFFVMAEFGEWLTARAERIRRWRWPQKLFEVTDRIEAWESRGK